ncbi:MAG TPA: NAD-dependent epimerase/dehydratase family protein [Terriglobales bacterium]|nr:NAD-dependent epimerase/dehydratase family protein [Terriglobales bacterium]
MRILVIGGNGFIGTPVVRELLEAGQDVSVLHRRRDTSPAQGVAQIEGDRNRLRDYEAELRRFAPQVIIDMILSSGEQADQLVDLAADLQARVVAISSMDVYRAWGVMQGTEPGGLEPMPITEDSPLRTARKAYPPELVEAMKSIFSWLNPGYDKIAVEQSVMRGRIGGTVVRLPMVYGPGDPLHRLHGMLQRIRDGRPAIILAEDHARWRGPRGYVKNVAHAIAVASISDAARARIYNVCDEPTLPELEWQAKVVAQTTWSGRLVVLPTRLTPKHLFMRGNTSQHLVASSERIRSELGYQEPFTMDEAIARTIAWEQANPPTGPSLHQFDYPAEDAALAQAPSSPAD